MWLWWDEESKKYESSDGRGVVLGSGEARLVDKNKHVKKDNGGMEKVQEKPEAG